jgi:hypothetical protein
MRSAPDAQKSSVPVKLGRESLAGLAPEPALGQENIPVKFVPTRGSRALAVARAGSVLRRGYCLKGVCVLILWLTVLQPEPARAINAARCEVDGRFGRNETAILRRACNAAVERLQSEEVRRVKVTVNVKAKVGIDVKPGN